MPCRPNDREIQSRVSRRYMKMRRYKRPIVTKVRAFGKVHYARESEYLRRGEALQRARKAFIMAFVQDLKDFETSVRGEKISRSFSSNFQEKRATLETPARPERGRRIKWASRLELDQGLGAGKKREEDRREGKEGKRERAREPTVKYLTSYWRAREIFFTRFPPRRLMKTMN